MVDLPTTQRHHPLARPLLLAVLLLVIVGALAPVTATASAKRSGRFVILTSVSDITLCVGEQKSLEIRVPVELPEEEVADDESAYLHLPEQGVSLAVEPRNVVQLTPSFGRTHSHPGGPLIVKVTGQRPGEADITINHHFDEWTHFLFFTWHSAPRATPVTVHVTVEACYEAYASALESTFTQADMGGLDDPFLLSGYLANTSGLTSDTVVMWFGPHPQDFSHGAYAKIEQLDVAGFACTNYSSGRYEVIFYTANKSEGDIILEGTVTLVCGVGSSFSGPESVRVAFRAKSP